MTLFEMWVQECKNRGRTIVVLEKHEQLAETGVYMTKSESVEMQDRVYQEPQDRVFHVWILGKWIRSTLNMRQAYRLYESGVDMYE